MYYKHILFASFYFWLHLSLYLLTTLVDINYAFINIYFNIY